MSPAKPPGGRPRAAEDARLCHTRCRTTDRRADGAFDPRPSSGAAVQEMREQAKNGTAEIRLEPDENNIFRWKATVQGPEDTGYEGGSFHLAIQVPEQYPLVPPAIRFVTKVFHPNVHFKTGEICLDILKAQWSPAWTLHSLCQAVLALLSSPEADSPLNCDAGNLLRFGDVRGYNSLARMYTVEYAKPAPSP